MSVQHSILLVGESNVGKTHYGAQFLKRLNQETEPKIQDKTTERVQKRDTHEQSL